MLVVFDLDFTLWDAGGTWCSETTPPYIHVDGYIEDGEGRSIYLYPDVRQILQTLGEKGITMAVASRSLGPEIARNLLDLFGIRNYFSFEEIYPGSKVQHFEALQKRSGFRYHQMYFFDDEQRNVDEVGAIGVNTHRVLSGLEWPDLSYLSLL